MQKLKAELINGNIPNSTNERRFLIGYWLAQLCVMYIVLHVHVAVRVQHGPLVHWSVCTCIVQCVCVCGIKRGQSYCSGIETGPVIGHYLK